MEPNINPPDEQIDFETAYSLAVEESIKQLETIAVYFHLQGYAIIKKLDDDMVTVTASKCTDFESVYSVIDDYAGTDDFTGYTNDYPYYDEGGYTVYMVLADELITDLEVPEDKAWCIDIILDIQKLLMDDIAERTSEIQKG